MSLAKAREMDSGSVLRAEDAFLDDMSLVYRLAYYYMGYLLSPFALVVIGASLVLNRVVVMASVQSRGASPAGPQRLSLPLWSRLCFHGGMLGFLGYTLAQLMDTIPTPLFYLHLLLVLAASQIVETFMAVTTNTKPLTDFDCSLLELSFQFFMYAVHTKHKAPLSPSIMRLEQQQMQVEGAFALLNAVTVHLLELTNTTHWRLAVSSLLTMLYSQRSRGNMVAVFSTVPLYFTFLRWWFKLVPVIVVGSTVWYNIARLVVGNMEARAFFDWLHEVYRESATQDAMMTLLTLARTMLKGSCEEGESDEDDLGDEEDEYEDTHPNSVYISGYLNKLKTTPEDVKSHDAVVPVENKNRIKLNIPFIFTKFRVSVEILQMAFYILLVKVSNITSRILVLLHISNPPQNDEILQDDREIPTSRNKRDLNRLITSYNYQKFLARYPAKDPAKSGGIAQFNIEAMLLPDFDSSPDYHMPYDSEHNKVLKSADKEAFVPSDLKEIRDEMAQLFLDFNSSMVESTENLNWHNSMYSILKYELENDKERITRSQYGKLNDEVILDEVALERWTAVDDFGEHTNDHEHDNDNDLDYSPDKFDLDLDESDDESDMMCIICLQEARNVVFWPCKCLAVCDDCRQALGSRGFQTCVTCKSKVDGYTKINIV